MRPPYAYPGSGRSAWDRPVTNRIGEASSEQENTWGQAVH